MNGDADFAEADTSDVGDEFTLTPEFKVVTVDFERAFPGPGKLTAWPEG